VTAHLIHRDDSKKIAFFFPHAVVIKEGEESLFIIFRGIIFFFL
jgi:hypothetical protein